MEKVNPEDIHTDEEDVLEEEWNTVIATVNSTYSAVTALQVTVNIVVRILRSLALALVLMLMGATLASLL
jgi:hypothetical protein